MSNPFYDPDDDVDDEEFLRNSRGPRAGQPGQPGFGIDPVEARRQTLMEKRREIEQRTVDSSSRSIGLLYESEKVGIATAEELNRQKEQLKATEGRLDDINATLKQSERHLTGIKSVFGGLKNYFAGRGAAAQPPAQPQRPVPAPPMGMGLSAEQDARLDGHRNDNHPALRMRGLDDDGAGGGQRSVDDILDKNLDEMSLGLGRLKGLAQGLNQELEDHNEIIDRLDHTTSSTQWRVEKQNKDMNKILGKK